RPRAPPPRQRRRCHRGGGLTRGARVGVGGGRRQVRPVPTKARLERPDAVASNFDYIFGINYALVGGQETATGVTNAKARPVFTETLAHQYRGSLSVRGDSKE